MASLRVLVPDELPTSSIHILEENGISVHFDPQMAQEKMEEEIGSFDGLIVRSRIRVTAPVLRKAVRLKGIVRSGTGVDNIDVAEAVRRGVVVMNVPGGNAISVAELVFGLALALNRYIVEATESLRLGRWEKKRLKGFELFGKTLGLVGFGRIGKEVARRALGFGMKVLVSDPYINSLGDWQGRVESCSLEDVLRQADVISLHVPLNDSTRNLIGESELKLCKPSAILINCSRGGVVDEAALYRALREKWIRGAGLDVFEREPPGEHPLLKLPNVVATPHLGASTAEAQVRTAEQAARQMADFLLHGKVCNEVKADI
jgi:D-3-phosphoglycerate dehydrogenase